MQALWYSSSTKYWLGGVLVCVWMIDVLDRHKKRREQPRFKPILIRKLRLSTIPVFNSLDFKQQRCIEKFFNYNNPRWPWIPVSTTITHDHQYKRVDSYESKAILNKGPNSYFSICTNLILNQYSKGQTQHSTIRATIWVHMTFTNNCLFSKFLK